MKSSTRFEITGRFVVGVWPLFTPHNTKIYNGHIVGNCRTTPTEIGAQLRHGLGRNWKELPHVALANLPAYDEQWKPTPKPEPGLRVDPKSVERFVRIYGGFLDAYGDDDSFDQDIAEVAKHQEILRRAWSFQVRGDDRDLFHVEDEIGWSLGDEHSFNVEKFPDQRYDELYLSTNDLWKFIGYLFLRDFVAGKIGFCGNPDCAAPYYLKSRNSQKYCELGPCAEYAHRQYALKWWRETGQKRRARKSDKSPRRKRR